MPSKFVAISLTLSAARALCSTVDNNASSRDTFNSTILPTTAHFTPIPYNLSVVPISPAQGQKVAMFEFPEILAAAAQPFSGILWGSSLSNVTKVLVGAPEGVGILDEPANYSTACSNATTMFNSTLIFMNCLILGFTSVFLDSGLISLNEDSVQIANSYLNFGDIRSFNGSGVLKDITTCISATCQNTTAGTCGWNVTSNLTEAYSPKYNATERLSRLYMGFNAYCDGQIARPNGDVVGPGVLIASFTQFAAVSFFFLASKFHRWARRLKSWHQKHQSRSDGKTYAPTPGPQADPNSKPSRITRAIARFSTAVESVFVDFHESQIFFLLTVQAATFWFFNQKKVIENSNTYAEASSTFWWAVILSLIVSIPVFLGQTILQRSGRHWWYTTLLTSTAGVVAWVLSETPSDLDYAAFWTRLKNDNPISECGGNPSPNTYCGVDQGANIYGRENFEQYVATARKDYSVISHEQNLLNLVDFVVIWAPTFLFVDQLFTWIRGLPFWSRILRFCKRASQWDSLSNVTQSHISKVYRLLVWAIWTTHQLLLVLCLVPGFSFLTFTFHVFASLAGGWSYGQLVAALIWAPLGLKLIYYTLFGVEKGVENRIGGRFKVQGKRDTDAFATQTEKTCPQEAMVKYTSVTDPRKEWETPRDDWQQTPKYTNAQPHIHHATREPSSYSPIPQDNENLSYRSHGMA